MDFLCHFLLVTLLHCWSSRLTAFDHTGRAPPQLPDPSSCGYQVCRRSSRECTILVLCTCTCTPVYMQSSIRHFLVTSNKGWRYQCRDRSCWLFRQAGAEMHSIGTFTRRWYSNATLLHSLSCNARINCLSLPIHGPWAHWTGNGVYISFRYRPEFLQAASKTDNSIEPYSVSSFYIVFPTLGVILGPKCTSCFCSSWAMKDRSLGNGKPLTSSVWTAIDAKQHTASRSQHTK